MKSRFGLVGLLIMGIIAFVLWQYAATQQKRLVAAIADPAATQSGVAPIPVVMDNAGPDAGQPAAMPTASGQPVVSEQALQLRQQLGQFLQDSPKLSAADRSSLAKLLSERINLLESTHQIDVDQAMVMRIAIIHGTLVDADAEDHRKAVAAIQRYRDEAARRKSASQSQRTDDPRYQSYKAMETKIATEVMSMTTIPGGLSRDEYLRQRLQQAREAAYRSP